MHGATIKVEFITFRKSCKCNNIWALNSYFLNASEFLFFSLFLKYINVTSVDTFACHAVKLHLNYSWLSRYYAVFIDRPSEERAYSISLIKSSLFVNCLCNENGGSKLIRNICNIYWSLRPDILEDLSFQQNSSKKLKSRNTFYVYVSFHKFVKVCLLSKRRTTIGLCAIV
jgi:hypothetical protein